jgi:hypothetical protein
MKNKLCSFHIVCEHIWKVGDENGLPSLEQEFLNKHK